MLNGKDLNSMSTKDVIDLYRKIKPIIRLEEKAYYIREFSSSEVLEESLQFALDDIVNPANMEDYETITEIIVFHVVTKIKVNKPTIAEIISQIPKELLDQVSAFEFVSAPEEYKRVNNYEFKPNVIYFSSAVRLYSMK